ncbi:hypothetical protein QBC45DRAFT_292258, partial [Copromyces sp. CBS 386.78]
LSRPGSPTATGGRSDGRNEKTTKQEAKRMKEEKHPEKKDAYKLESTGSEEKDKKKE